MATDPHIAALANSIANLLARGAVVGVDASGKLQTLQISLLADESKGEVEHLEPFGFTSHPLTGAEVLALFLGGDRSHGLVLSAADRRHRPQGMAGGETAVYNAHGMTIKLLADGIHIDGGGLPIHIDNAANVVLTDVGNLNLNGGAINIDGGNVNVTGGDVVADGVSLKSVA